MEPARNKKRKVTGNVVFCLLLFWCLYLSTCFLHQREHRQRAAWRSHLNPFCRDELSSWVKFDTHLRPDAI